jgi:hypothetical protein
VYLAIFRGSAIRSKYDALGLGRKPENGLPYSKGPLPGADVRRWTRCATVAHPGSTARLTLAFDPC